MREVVCHDGFRLSVQASSFHYCEPRIDNADKYVSFECGMPSESEPLLMPYIQQMSNWELHVGYSQDPRQCVYEYVPKAIIKKIIKKHGGIREHPDWEKGSPQSPFANTDEPTEDFPVVQAGFIAPSIACLETSPIRVNKEMVDNIDKISEFLEFIDGTLEENAYET